VVFVFIEKEEERFRSLNAVLNDVKPTLPENFKVHTDHGVFDDEMTSLFDRLDQQRAAIAPSLVFVDPFGFSQTPFRTIDRIMRYRHCEVLITFMYEEINRFLSHPSHTGTYDDLFGTGAWRRVLDVSDPATRLRTIHNIYRDQLRSVAKYVRSFKMLNRQNNTDYFLFFCTNELLGLERMKDSMWKVDPSGAYEFCDFTDAAGTMSLFSEGPDFAELKALIVNRFRGSAVEVKEIGDFVVANTPFRRAHFKTQILKPMEAESEISVTSPNPTRRRGTFPPGTVVRFP
jgi:three-Cys-motif partner protein